LHDLWQSAFGNTKQLIKFDLQILSDNYLIFLYIRKSYEERTAA
jgi:hypothetical protein